MARRFVVMTSMFVASWCTFGCSNRSCSEAGCIDGVEVRLASPLDGAQALSVVVRPDAETIECDYSESLGVDTCGPKGVWIQTNGGSVDGFILHAKHPEQLTFSFDSGGTVLVSETANPSYETQEPNGSDCPPICRNAVVQL